MMTPGLAIVLVAAALIAHANGANDVSKGIATLVGSGVTNYRRAIAWGTLFTAVGALAGAVFGHAMIATFGKGLITQGTSPTLPAALASIFGAAAWVLIATRTGLPVSTTHALVGAVTGVGLAAYGAAGINWTQVGTKILVPLLAGPLVSLALASILLGLARNFGSPTQAKTRDCLCIEAEPTAVLASACPMPAGISAATAIAMAPSSPVRITVADAASCAAERPAAARLTIGHLHWLSSGMACFARGLNDGPKIVALALSAAVLSGGSATSTAWFALITLAMVVGSLAGLRVTKVLAEGVTRLDNSQGLIASLVTATLVGLGALKGMPLSTTHVSTGAIVGAGVARGRGSVNWSAIRGISLAWIITLPASALLGVLVHAALRAAGI